MERKGRMQNAENSCNCRGGGANYKSEKLNFEVLKLSFFKNLSKKFLAFTLAEILITLTIVGVIAALTIPTLMKNYNNYANYVALKKSYSLLSNAYSRVEREYGKIDEWGITNMYDMKSVLSFAEKFEPHLKVVKKCVNTPGCWSKQPTKALDEKTTFWYSTVIGVGISIIVYKLEDGTNLSFNISTRREGQVYGIKSFGETYEYVGDIWVDVNGNKEPNVAGRDVFGFVVTERGFLPAGVDNIINCSPNRVGREAGITCAYRGLKDGGIKY